MKIKITYLFVLAGFAILLFTGTTSASSKPSKLETYHQWLQGDWGQINQDGSVVDMRGCELTSTTPEMMKNVLMARYGLPAGYFYRGVLMYGIMDGDLHVVSSYTAPKSVFKKPFDAFRRSKTVPLTLTPGVDEKGFVIFKFDKDVPGLKGLRTIIPLTNDSFKLVGKADAPNTDVPSYYFTRCDNL